MASVEYQNSILWKGDDPTKRKFKPAYDGTKKVARYWPGKEPKWAAQGEDDLDGDKGKDKEKGKAGERRTRLPKSLAPVEDAAASRLKRLAASESTGDTGQERLLRHRVLHDAQVIEARDDNEDEDKEVDSLVVPEASGQNLVEPLVHHDPDEDEDLRAMRREHAREWALKRRKDEEDALKQEELDDEDEEDQNEEESEYESDSDDNDPRMNALMKPVFVSKSQRETLKEKEMMQKEEEELEVKAKEKLKERKVETKSMVIDQIRQDEEAEREGLKEDGSDIELIDDDDEKNEAEEYELWKIRELKRIKRDKQERLERQKELEWIEKRRNMTEEERLEDDRKLDSKANSKSEAKQFNFMQKYYHRGGFFQDKAAAGEEPLYLRDYHEPLEEEKYDKNLLPKAMQLRRGLFGKKGQVKHSHLTDVDTTDFQAAWSQHNKQVQRYQEKMAGAKGVNDFSRPTASKSSRS